MRGAAVGRAGWTRLLVLFGVGCVSSCALVAQGPEPTLSFPSLGDEEADPLGELGANMRITVAVERHALRKPSLSRSVEAQVKAMLGYVRQHGRGELHEASLRGAVGASSSADAAYQRLYSVGLHAIAVLDLERGPAELSGAALRGLLGVLGDDASLTPHDEAQSEGTGLAMAQRDGVAFLGARRLDEATGDRIATVFTQWAASDRPPRAVILDLARCDDASPPIAAALVNAFAPDRLALEVDARDEKTGAPRRYSYRGRMDWSPTSFANVPVFVIVSERSAGLCEAVAHGLRHHRGARVLGHATRGDGRVMAWLELPDGGRFSFTVGDVRGPDQQLLRGRVVVPDVCRTDAGLTAIDASDVVGARTRCQAAPITQDEAIDYVRGALDGEAAPAGTGWFGGATTT